MSRDRYIHILNQCAKQYPHAPADKLSRDVFDEPFLCSAGSKVMAASDEHKSEIIGIIYRYGLDHGQKRGKSMPYSIEWKGSDSADANDHCVYIELAILPPELLAMICFYLESV
jgi:hypothetical protein